ncbi:MAG: GntR family transcriptional regulator [Advenella sp.]|uniref:GntR family transcriptional regulator n=1 Tax=Advenella sp. TaxID=1872388 RepID=UPI0026C74605
MATPMDLHIHRENTTLRQHVTERLREAVISGTFTAGQKLVEKDLCAMLGISRTVLRESLQQLNAEGLITNIPHRGPVVATISREEVKDIYQVRQALEALAGEGFAIHASEAQIQALQDCLERLKAIGEGRSTDSILDIKNLFYRILLEGCGNDVVKNLLTQLNNRIMILRRISLSGTERLPHTIKEISDIVDAVSMRNAKLAKKLCARHVANAAEAAMKYLDL